MMNEKNTRALFRAEKSGVPKVIVGLLFGLVTSALVAWYFLPEVFI
ncbi:MAG: hypothetical protein ACXW2U_13885 [Telluria sp.]